MHLLLVKLKNYGLPQYSNFDEATRDGKFLDNQDD